MWESGGRKLSERHSSYKCLTGQGKRLSGQLSSVQQAALDPFSNTGNPFPIQKLFYQVPFKDQRNQEVANLAEAVMYLKAMLL